MKRPLPSEDDAARILAVKRTRPSHRAPPPAGRRLNRLLKSLDERFGQGADGLAAHWREIAGEVLARSTEPVKLTRPRSGGAATLEIRVSGPAAALIQHQAPEILSRVNLFLGAGAVGKLRIVQAPLSRPMTPVKGAARRAKPPLDAAKEAELTAATAEGPLKDALIRLGRGVLRQTPR